MTLVDPLPAGAFTLTGQTTGPAVNMGRCRWGKSQMMYVSLRELNDLVVRAGWHGEQAYQLLLADFKAAEAHIDQLMDTLADADDKIDALERAFDWKPKEKPQNGKSQRSTAKRAAV